jgi:hypothetical protein
MRKLENSLLAKVMMTTFSLRTEALELAYTKVSVEEVERKSVSRI